jgi:outer membrane immunogenic protein
MKKLLLGIIALTALGAGVTANAAEIAVPRRAAYVAPVAYTNWTGCHLGGQVGYEWAHNDGFSTTGASTAGVGGNPAPFTKLTPSFGMSGFLGGVYGGCDYQFGAGVIPGPWVIPGAWVVGIEADWASIRNSGQAFDLGAADVGFPGGVTTFRRTSERWVTTLRGRLGWAADKWLLYVTGGPAWARINSLAQNIDEPGLNMITQTDTRIGWTIGTGIEYAIAWGWSARAQYLFVEIPNFTTFTPGMGPGTAEGNAWNNLNNGPIHNHLLEFGLTYKFGDFAYAPR